MSKIPVSALIAMFQTMEAEHWAYEWGACKRGVVDCAGAFKWAFEQHGRSLYHGSNRIAREEVDRLYPVGSVQVVPGMAAFKHRIPGDKGYNLPSSYKPGGSHYNGDLNDYYHIGLVDEDTARVLNAQSASTGFVASPISQNWSHVGYLRQVDYGADMQVGIPEAAPAGQPDAQPTASSGVAYVYAANGEPVKARDKPSDKCRLWTKLPVGTQVELRGPDSGGWTPVRCGKDDGYIMTKYLVFGEADGSSYAVTFYDLNLAQAKELMAKHSGYRSTLEERHG